MIAVIDSGNSGIKLGIFDKETLVKSYNSVVLAEIKKILASYSLSRIVISNVSGNIKHLLNSLPDKDILIVTPYLKYPFTIDYQTPESLGTDRIAAIAGAWQRYGPANILVLDAGSCITYDFINDKAIFLGGGISPGIAMRLKALNKFTASLPEVSLKTNYALFGVDTTSSILSGTLGGGVSEIIGIIRNFREKYSGLKVVLCGGNAGFFESKLKDAIFVVPDLVLWGLAVISGYNEN